MLYAFLIALAIAVVLGIAYYFELKSSRKQADEQKQLLADYQRRVDEQQKLLEDYRALEKNFDNVGEGYEQALLAFDKMEEEKEKSRQANEALEKRCNALYVELNQLKETTQKKAEVMNPLMQQLQSALRATGDIKLQGMLAKIVDLDDIPADLPPIRRGHSSLGHRQGPVHQVREYCGSRRCCYHALYQPQQGRSCPDPPA